MKLIVICKVVALLTIGVDLARALNVPLSRWMLSGSLNAIHRVEQKDKCFGGNGGNVRCGLQSESASMQNEQ